MRKSAAPRANPAKEVLLGIVTGVKAGTGFGFCYALLWAWASWKILLVGIALGAILGAVGGLVGGILNSFVTTRPGRTLAGAVGGFTAGMGISVAELIITGSSPGYPPVDWSNPVTLGLALIAMTIGGFASRATEGHSWIRPPDP